MRELSPVLIAGRGEIVVRVARTVHALGLDSVGVFTAADAGALHADALDAAVTIDSYLDVEELLRAARATGARSVHPGYGFLAENAGFARAVLDAGLGWIGPPPEAIELMGDKRRAKRVAAAAGLAIVPEGVEGGYPVMVKALAGGGGKGMRVARSPGELDEAQAAARREAQAAFGDGRILIERCIEPARHIEIQLLADRHGGIVHLGERECSLQRRHQKVLEESPSPVVDSVLRARLGESALALARACGYQGAGTVELIATADLSEIYFLEMNTRLQVEHPVTELVYGVDLVEHQLRIAAGERLALRQEEVAGRGHAVEARVYAEDPANGLLPAAGRVRVYSPPEGVGVRVDSGIRVGSEVGTAYDPLLVKVIAHGGDRETALARLERGLAHFDLLGVPTNLGLVRALVRHEDVRAGVLDTGLLERALGQLAPSAPDDLLPAGVAVAAGSARPEGPWRRKLAGHGEARLEAGRVSAGERTWEVASVRFEGEHGARIAIDGVDRRYAFWVDDEAIWIGRGAHQLELREQRPARRGEGELLDTLKAPMPGTVLLVNVADGDRVAAGEALIVIESMKMELSIAAPHAGTVAGLALSPGDRVARGQRLLVVEGDDRGGAPVRGRGSA